MVKDGLEVTGRKVVAGSFRYCLSICLQELRKYKEITARIPCVPADMLCFTFSQLCKLPNSNTDENIS